MNVNSPSNPNYFYQELDKKNKEIRELKEKVSTLLDEKILLNKTINDLREKNKKLIISEEKENQKLDSNNNRKIKELYQILNIIQNENKILKDKLSKQDNFEKDFNNTVKNKLTQAQRNVDNLSVLNTIKDNIILDYQDFVNTLNEIVGKKFNFILDFSNDKIDTYKINLTKIQNKVLEHLNYEKHHRPYIDPIPKDLKDDLLIVHNKNNNNNNQENNLNKEFSDLSEILKDDSGIIKSTLKSLKGKLLYKSNKPQKIKKKKFPIEDLCVNTKSCNCRFKEYNNNNYKYKPSYTSTYRSTNYSKKNSNFGLRSPTRDSD